MTIISIQPSQLCGTIIAPPSKSHTMRAILLATFASGTSTISNYLQSPDVDAMINACRLLGAAIDIDENNLYISGVAGQPQIPMDVINAANSGQVLRFIAAMAALNDGYTIITGDESIRSRRPMQPLLTALQQLKVTAVSTKGDGYAPVIIKGSMTPGHCHLSGKDSQPVSALLMAAAFNQGVTEIIVDNPGEQAWIDLTLDWLQRLGVCYQNQHYTHYKVVGSASINAFDYQVPGDFSSIAYPLVAALITHSAITINNVDMSDSQGDKQLIEMLQHMGADLHYLGNSLQVNPSQQLRGVHLDVNPFIDAICILAVLACFAEGETILSNAAIARHKESDRLTAMTMELRKMGANIQATQDSLIIQPAQLYSANVDSHHDHRVALSLAVAALAANGTTTIAHSACVSKSYANFVPHMQQLQANIKECA